MDVSAATQHTTKYQEHKQTTIRIVVVLSRWHTQPKAEQSNIHIEQPQYTHLMTISNWMSPHTRTNKLNTLISHSVYTYIRCIADFFFLERIFDYNCDFIRTTLLLFLLFCVVYTLFNRHFIFMRQFSLINCTTTKQM